MILSCDFLPRFAGIIYLEREGEKIKIATLKGEYDQYGIPNVRLFFEKGYPFGNVYHEKVMPFALEKLHELEKKML